MELLNIIDHRDVWVRALKTGIVVFLVTLAHGVTNWQVLPSLDTLQTLGFSALAAGGTAVLNYLWQSIQITLSDK